MTITPISPTQVSPLQSSVKLCFVSSCHRERSGSDSTITTIFGSVLAPSASPHIVSSIGTYKAASFPCDPENLMLAKDGEFKMLDPEKPPINPYISSCKSIQALISELRKNKNLSCSHVESCLPYELLRSLYYLFWDLNSKSKEEALALSEEEKLREGRKLFYKEGSSSIIGLLTSPVDSAYQLKLQALHEMLKTQVFQAYFWEIDEGDPDDAREHLRHISLSEYGEKELGESLECYNYLLNALGKKNLSSYLGKLYYIFTLLAIEDKSRVNEHLAYEALTAIPSVLANPIYTRVFAVKNNYRTDVAVTSDYSEEGLFPVELGKFIFEGKFPYYNIPKAIKCMILLNFIRELESSEIIAQEILLGKTDYLPPMHAKISSHGLSPISHEKALSRLLNPLAQAKVQESRELPNPLIESLPAFNKKALLEIKLTSSTSFESAAQASKESVAINFQINELPDKPSVKVFGLISALGNSSCRDYCLMHLNNVLKFELEKCNPADFTEEGCLQALNRCIHILHESYLEKTVNTGTGYKSQVHLQFCLLIGDKLYTVSVGNKVLLYSSSKMTPLSYNDMLTWPLYRALYRKGVPILPVDLASHTFHSDFLFAGTPLVAEAGRKFSCPLAIGHMDNIIGCQAIEGPFIHEPVVSCIHLTPFSEGDNPHLVFISHSLEKYGSNEQFHQLLKLFLEEYKYPLEVIVNELLRWCSSFLIKGDLAAHIVKL